MLFLWHLALEKFATLAGNHQSTQNLKFKSTYYGGKHMYVRTSNYFCQIYKQYNIIVYVATMVYISLKK